MKQFVTYEHVVSQIRTCCYVPPGTGTLVHHNRSSHGLALHLSGRTIYRFDTGLRVEAPADHVIFLPKGSSYQVETDTRGDCWAINFYLAQEEDFPPFAFHCPSPGPYAEAFDRAVRHWKTKGEGYRLRCMSCLYQLLYLLRRDYAFTFDHSVSPKKALLEPALEYIRANYTQQPIRVEELARVCGISQVYLRRLFNELYGTSPLKYVNARKLELAKELLASQLYSIRDLAALTGYSDECVFSREFKKATGLSPRAYLARQQDG